MYYCNECGERLNSEDEAVQHFVEAHRDVLLAMFILEEADALRDCSKCKHFEDRGADEYSCKYLREGKVVFQSDSTDTAESCPYYEEADA